MRRKRWRSMMVKLMMSMVSMMQLMMAMELVMIQLRRRRMVKTCNMRGGGVGDTRVFPREYQSGLAPPPQKMLQASRKWDVCQLAAK